MVLARLQCRRFFRLFGLLTSYANECLDVVDPRSLAPNGQGGVADPQERAKVTYELWQNLQVIDAYVRDNPDGLSAGELETVQSWRGGLADTFLVDVFPDGEIRFVGAGYAFEVCGLTREIADMIGALPAAVQTTLLPFEGKIVFADYLGDHLIDFGDGILDMFDREIERLFDEDKIARTSDELLRAADEIRDKQLERDMEDLVAELERGDFLGVGEKRDELDDEDAADEGDYAQHRGALAGMSFEEREAAIQQHIDETRGDDAPLLVELLEGSCGEGDVTSSLADLLAADDSFDVRRAAKLMGVEAARDAEIGRVIAGIVDAVGTAGALDGLFDGLSRWRIETLRELAQRGGRWEVAASDVRSLRDLPSHEIVLSYVFREGDAFVFIMPDEVLSAVQTLDWEALIEREGRVRQLIDYADTMAELRGIAPLIDVVDGYRRQYPDGFAFDEIPRVLMQAVVDGSACYDLLQTEEQTYVLHYELFWAYQDEMGLERHAFTAMPVTRGELGEMLEGLLAQQDGKEPRYPTEAMLAAQSLFDWKMAQGPARAFCQFLDANVPDVRDDYYFADKVMEELILDCMWGLMDKGAQRLFDILEANDFIPDHGQIQRILDLWSNLCNGLPIWPNNGWSPNELAHVDLGRPVFFNDDGSMMKVGRNDPCPCGSGLKYKKCCGR